MATKRARTPEQLEKLAANSAADFCKVALRDLRTGLIPAENFELIARLPERMRIAQYEQMFTEFFTPERISSLRSAREHQT